MKGLYPLPLTTHLDQVHSSNNVLLLFVSLVSSNASSSNETDTSPLDGATGLERNKKQKSLRQKRKPTRYQDSVDDISFDYLAEHEFDDIPPITVIN